jgi:putative flippase GtrA
MPLYFIGNRDATGWKSPVDGALTERALSRAVRQASDPTTQRLAVLGQFIRFGLAGSVGFCFDTATVYALRGAVGLYVAGVVAYVMAATVNWAINRAWAFRGQGGGRAHRQLGLFLLTSLGGFVLNRGVYAALITWSALCASQPVLALAAGTAAGMFVNFALARAIVFR